MGPLLAIVNRKPFKIVLYLPRLGPKVNLHIFNLKLLSVLVVNEEVPFK